MENALKCPFCGNNLRKLFNKYTAEPNQDFECGNYDCDLYGIEIPEFVWKSLAREKQDLGIAREALRVVRNQYRLVKPKGFSPRGDMATLCAMGEFAEKALEQIEHKA